jgi:hypothetical protein
LPAGLRQAEVETRSEECRRSIVRDFPCATIEKNSERNIAIS